MPAPRAIAPLTLARPDGHVLAYDRLDGAGPAVVFLHGLNSDRGGTKALALEAHCRAAQRSFVRFDMFGHGQSSGAFTDGGPTRWADDAVAVIDRLTQGPVVLAGSSMGGWIMLLAARARPERVAGLLGIAAAPDFTEDLMWAQFTPGQRAALAAQGFVDLPSDYADGPYRIGRHLIEDGRKNLVLRGSIALSCPVRLMHGQSDQSVPWQTALTLAGRLVSAQVETVLIKDGDHRLSRPADLKRLCNVLDDLLAAVGAVS
ncbi:MAG: alpha/beta hydrolase [Rhodospirillaceae bacterium]|nr:alpha/beta hydrolase [Rhodospirillaceae bacterium]